MNLAQNGLIYIANHTNKFKIKCPINLLQHKQNKTNWFILILLSHSDFISLIFFIDSSAIIMFTIKRLYKFSAKLKNAKSRLNK
jgi:hypothetical protein